MQQKETVTKMITLADYKIENRFYEFDPNSKNLRVLDHSVERTYGFVSFQITSVLAPKILKAGCYFINNCLSIFVDERLHCFDSTQNLVIQVECQKLFSWKKTFSIIHENKLLENIKYVSLSKSTEEWPDDFRDIFVYMSKLPFVSIGEIELELTFNIV
jgi:hypothetical protein